MTERTLKLVYAFFLMCLALVTSALHPGLSSHSYVCNRERKVLTGKHGIISSGNGEYPADSHCEWLIKASYETPFITLSFIKLDTECSYDHVFIYDGESYTSPLLASFSGNTTPSSITATRGSMLILLYSDTNYARSGIEAVYSMTECPMNCSSKGKCQNHRCFCHPSWFGNACEFSLCPNDCGAADGKGDCDKDISSFVKCKCKPGYSGMDCSLPDSNKSGGNTWHLIASHGIIARAGHIGTYVQLTDSFYVFGGYTFKKVLGDMFMFSFESNKWINITTSNSPCARHGHAAISHNDIIIVYGGELGNGSLSNELWFFNVSNMKWSLIGPNSNFTSVAIAKHSVTLVGSCWLYVIGGSLSDGTFSSKIYKVNICDKNEWQVVDIFGTKESSQRLVGHSAVYDQQTRTIFIFGGITAEYSHVSKLSNYMYAFHVEKKYWVRINYQRNAFIPLERAFHTAAIIGDYMIVYGGYTHKHSEEEICYDNETHLYHLRCHSWIDFGSLKNDFAGISNPITQGIFSHSMGVRRGHTLVIFGGYSGIMRPQLLAYVLPVTVVSDQHLFNHCTRHKYIKSCLANLACGWCFENNVCMERKNINTCSRFSMGICPGFCSALSDCISCSVLGQSFIENDISDKQDYFPSTSCSWCLQDFRCHSLDDETSNCSNTSFNGERVITAPGFVGWWLSKASDISTLKDCYLKDSPPGLISVKYRHPINWSQPDDVNYLHQTSEDIYFHPDPPRNDSYGMEENIVKFLGFLHPLNAKPLSERIKLKLTICSTGSTAILKLSNDSTSNHLEIVASQNPSVSFDCLDAQRSRGASLFPDVSVGHKYLFDFTVKHPVASNETFKIQLKWTAFSVESEVIDHKYLELYKNGSCAVHHNCLACVTDAKCGWCESRGSCYSKINQFHMCLNADENSFLVIHPSSCSVCSDYIYCEQCTQVSICEWIPDEGNCVRRGRRDEAIRNPKSCPVPCPMRTTCASCLGDPGVCAWCEETKTCFLFSTYTSAFSYGRCRDWVDENRNERKNHTSLCRNCSRHTQCSSCIKDLSCGWCSYSKYPLNGLCIEGDFSGPYSGTCPSLLRNETQEPPDSQWSYGACPDLEECLWDLHDCHKNATCKNTAESYTCECNAGFEGDGRTCIRACSVKCQHGYCSDAPDYKCVCDLGWTGEDCSVNCGCNNHSTCHKGVGICDECQDWTEGQFCEKCRAGSYGYTTDAGSCQKCDCNGHGNYELGYCNATTGVCFCLNNTVGPNCEKCKNGYYGEPRDNGECFEECHPRKIITNAIQGKFGSPSMSYESEDCLWLITVHAVLDMQSLLGPMQRTGTYLQIVIHKDINIPCPHNHVYVYDGLPNFVASGHPNILLGSFCGTNLTEPIVATATSGYLTVHFKRGSLMHGFNATYVRIEHCSLSNSTDCYSDDMLNENETCTENSCPNNCSYSLNQGHCDMVYCICICEKNFGGNDCSARLMLHHLVWTYLYSYQQIRVHDLLQHLPSGKIGHSLLSLKDKSVNSENLWLFGGYSTTFGYSDDIFFYNTSSHRWKKIATDYSPASRLFHAAASVNESIFIYGGLSDSDVHGDFWEFNIPNKVWMKLPGISIATGTLKMAGCTLTAVNEWSLVLIGGISPIYGFFEKIMEFDTENRQWLLINSSGAQPIGLYGHTSVYHSFTESIYVFGGVSYDTEHVAPSNFLYSFHYPSKQWYRLPPDNKVNTLKTRPLPRYFHSSVVTENYMVVFGGHSTSNTEDPIRSFAYMFSCNLWIPLTDEAIEVIGTWPNLSVGAAAAVANNAIYIFGDFGGDLMKLSLPDDICLLFSASRVGCIQQTGCAFCSLSENGLNQTFCYSQDKHAESRCYNPKESNFFFTVSCNSDWIKKRDCHQYTSCTDCVTSWPFYKSAKQMCQWCSNCRAGRCVPVGLSCDDENDCNIPRKVIEEPSMCPLRVCGASDCEKCGALHMCIWTRQVHRSSGFGHTLNKNPIYNWVCVMMEIQSVPTFPIDSMPPLECPISCYQYPDCTSCLQSQGGDGGWHQCLWSVSKGICMSPSFELLGCEDGSCGPVLRGNESICPFYCWQFDQASYCLSQAKCGWCAFSGPKVDGRGLCMDGGILGPTGGICRENQVLLLGLPLPLQTIKWLQMAEGPPTWTYLTKPPENECSNGHHNCDDTHEECVDTYEGFECRCKPGYKMKESHCTPTCRQGCVNGTCIQPDVCQCNFGFVGKNCSIMCKCNGHSNCPGPDGLDVCLECKNNTFGEHCEKCKPLFVGNPVNGGKCVSCHDYCYTHTGVCFGADLANSTLNQPYNYSYINEILERLVQGPLEDAVCIDCKNNTEGKRCDQCISGFFKAGENLEDGCRPCECHGHGDTCNPVTGENCNCQNNTVNDIQCSQNSVKSLIHMTPCWQLQCSKCKEYFLGSPSHGHQCYRHMYLDKEYCFDPNTQDECRKPSPLLRGHTVFFAVQPRYMNVDIRIVVDVTKGGIDFFLSAKEDAFIVDVDKASGLHHIYVDEKYGIDLSAYDVAPEVQTAMRRKKRDTAEEASKESSNLTETVPAQNLQPKIGDAQGLTTYIDVKKSEDFLLVRNLENRLVVTIPQEVHDLRTTRFYMILRGSEKETYGSLFFRQDQTRIDLFVFFSVFFSCFFLFLAVCVVVWKVKQAFDLRRARRLHAAEMKHMASRPFGRIITVVDDEPDDTDFYLYSPSNYRKKLKHMKVHGKDSPKQIEEKLSLRPLAVEPLSDGFGAIATILVQLPGGAQSLVRMSLASGLITARSSHYHIGCGLRAAMRRRTSHANV